MRVLFRTLPPTNIACIVCNLPQSQLLHNLQVRLVSKVYILDPTIWFYVGINQIYQYFLQANRNKSANMLSEIDVCCSAMAVIVRGNFEDKDVYWWMLKLSCMCISVSSLEPNHEVNGSIQHSSAYLMMTTAIPTYFFSFFE